MSLREMFDMARELARVKIELRQALKLGKQWKRTAERLHQELEDKSTRATIDEILKRMDKIIIESAEAGMYEQYLRRLTDESTRKTQTC